MTQITFIHRDGREETVDAPENWSIMQIAVEHDIDGIQGACGGAMACATCHCYIPEAWEERVDAQDNEKCDEEEDILDTAFEVKDNSRLGCQIKINSSLDGLRVGLPGSDI